MLESEINSKLIEVFSILFDLKDEKEIIAYAAEKSDKWDSLNHIHLVTALEEKFNMTFTPDEMNLINSFETAKWLIQDKLNEKV